MTLSRAVCIALVAWLVASLSLMASWRLNGPCPWPTFLLNFVMPAVVLLPPLMTHMGCKSQKVDAVVRALVGMFAVEKR